jgi:hypothetical protein
MLSGDEVAIKIINKEGLMKNRAKQKVNGILLSYCHKLKYIAL